MSIETEKWEPHGTQVRDFVTKEVVLAIENSPPDFVPEEERWAWYERRSAAASTLPEALALLKRVLEKNAMDRLDDTEARDILRRAGVLGA